MYTNRKEGGGAGWQGDFVEELLDHRAGSVSDGRGEAEELATE
jgi:hypothetical protein